MQPYLIEMLWSAEDNAYLCIAPDLPGCSAVGDTPVEAVREMQDAMTAWLEACVAMGREQPQPIAQFRRVA
ncbi:type II toxin-antitoxin system HicB family antitoxin [Rhodoferax sp. 4810]|uniref:Type II toxin-antitoxin system HicB family antitoxin n=1 Tax=Thiospirillum jenense TaxID=1653858 RepID=A0A839HEI4_9GAMM|nr:type II toxin-antitoxin system HicB family antitoxin [Thiospirillum jenense]MBB1074717.1 type II toxin-antitoxin system HicB family antitoxin [Rhodoferax jenense]MBB1125439.1 type II toxin-antitoxin system HicB family antitoxin [Thiospirillum jenense]